MHVAILVFSSLFVLSQERRVQSRQGHAGVMWSGMRGGRSSGSWSLACEAEDLELKIDGKVVTCAEANSHGGSSFALEVGPNLVEFADKGDDGVEITLNRSPEKHKKSGRVELHFNKYACCVGQACVMWPKTIPVGGWGLAPASLDSDASLISWSLACEVDDLQLKIDGKIVTAAEANLRAGSSFAMEVGPNLVEFADKGADGVEITLNRSPDKHRKSGEVELHFNQIACCVGNACVMWPKNIPPEGWGVNTSELDEEDDATFLRRMQETLGDADFNALVSLLRSPVKNPVESSAESPSEKPEVKESLHSDRVKELHSEQELQYLIQAAGSRLVVIDFWAPWCIPCKRFAPLFYKHAEDPANADVLFGKLNIQETNALLKLSRDAWGVETLPSFLFIKNGKVVNRLSSADEEEFLRLMVESKVAVASGHAPQAQAEARPTEYDLVVIGGGSGGLAAAKEAAKHGARVALFDYVKPSPRGTQWGFGGTCVNVGCIPKKLMHYAALCGEASKDAAALGWNLPEEPSHSWEKMVAAVQAHVKKLNFFYENGVKAPKEDANGNLPHAGVWYFNALARFETAHEVSWRDSLGNEGVVKGSQFIVAAGGRPAVPDIPGSELAITSDDLFSLEESPGKVLIVGAGYIALEVGGFLTNLGHETHIAVRSTPLRVGFDKDASALAVELMKLQGTKFWSGWNVKRLQKDNGKIKATLYSSDGEDTAMFDTVLFATGRYCDTEKLNLEAVGVTTDRGKIVVDERECTSAGHIYAIGDVAQHSNSVSLELELTPVAIQSGEMLARRLYSADTKLMDYSNVATTVFTPFEIGTIGLTEHDAIAKYGKDDIETYIKVYESLEVGAVHRQTRIPYQEKVWDDVKKAHVDSDRQSTDFPPNAMAKVVCLKSENCRVVGFHYVGPNAGELAQGFAVAIKLGATMADFNSTVGIHPTDAESFTMLETTKSSGQDWVASGGCGGGKCG